MAKSLQRALDSFRVHPAALATTVFLALVLQTYLPVRWPSARLFDFPLLVALYIAMIRRNKTLAIAVCTAIGLLQDALASGLVGMFGMAKALTGYLAASVAIKFELEALFPRMGLTAALVLVHGLALALLYRVLLNPPPDFRIVELAAAVLANTGCGMVLFLLLDRLRKQ
jgi:rod shape-determining protein MreD